MGRVGLGFGKLEGAAGQQRRAALLLAHPDFGSYLHPCNVITIVCTILRMTFYHCAVYTAERFVLQETFLSLKIRGFKSRVGYNGARTIYRF